MRFKLVKLFSFYLCSLQAQIQPNNLSYKSIFKRTKVVFSHDLLISLNFNKVNNDIDLYIYKLYYLNKLKNSK